jgi:type IX secretion system substrate protein
MIRILLFFLGLLFWTPGYSQSVSPEVTASAGDHFSGTNVQLSWTIGEIMVETYVNDMNQLTQGFHQANLIVSAVEDQIEWVQINVFPNPTSNILNIEWSENEASHTMSLYDASGKLLMSQKKSYQFMPDSLDLSAYPAGSYLLRFTNHNKNQVKTFKILKIK